MVATTCSPKINIVRVLDRLGFGLDDLGWSPIFGSEILSAIDEETYLEAMSVTERMIDRHQAVGHAHLHGRALFQPRTAELTTITPRLRSGHAVHRYEREPCPIAELSGFYPEISATPCYFMNRPGVRQLIAFLYQAGPRTALPDDELYEVMVDLRIDWTSENRSACGDLRIMRGHRDRLVAVFSLARTPNLVGGESYIGGLNLVGKYPADLEANAVKRLTLNRPLDGYLLDGRRVSTSLGLMRSSDGLRASRASLTIGFVPTHKMWV